MKHLYLTLVFAAALVPSIALAQSPGDVVSPSQATLENFEPITAIPVFDSVKESGGVDLASFFNQLYVLAVGAAAIVAVAQIMLAGFTLAYSVGNHSTIGEAREKIQNAVLGLLLVLSPTIVFGIINPDILNLKIDTSGLTDREAVPDTPADGTAVPGQLPKTEDVAVTLRGNTWGALDNVCDFKAGTGAYLGFHIPEQIGIKAFGNGISVSQGEQCCAATSGKITTTASGQEVCDLSSLIEGGRYVAHIKGVAIYAYEDQNGIPANVTIPFEMFTSGAGGGGAFGDIDTIAIHGFRTTDGAAGCQTFVNGLTPASLLGAYKGAKVFSPRIGLLEGKVYPTDVNLQRSKLVSIEQITEKTCSSKIEFWKN